MTFEFSGSTYTIPDTLADISVAQRITYSEEYGADLSERGKDISEVNDPEDRKDLASQILAIDQVTQALAFFSGIPLDSILASMDLGDVIELVTQTEIAIAVQGEYLPLPGKDIPLPDMIITSGIDFKIFRPVDSITDEISREVFLCSLKAGRYMLELLAGVWDNFPAICGAYVRLPTEEMSLELMDPEGPRFAIFSSMDMAQGLALAQYFIREVAGLLSVLDTYTMQQLASPPSP